MRRRSEFGKSPGGKGVMLVPLTGWGEDEDRRKSDEAGFAAHAIKPMDPEPIRKLLTKNRAHTA